MDLYYELYGNGHSVAKVLEIPGADHMMMLIHPDEL